MVFTYDTSHSSVADHAAAQFQAPLADAIGAPPREYNGPDAFQCKIRVGDHTMALIKVPPKDSLVAVIVPIEELAIEQVAPHLDQPIIYLDHEAGTKGNPAGVSLDAPNMRTPYHQIVGIFEREMIGQGSETYYTSTGIYTLTRTEDDLTVYRRWGVNASDELKGDLDLPQDQSDLTGWRVYHLSLIDGALSIFGGFAYRSSGSIIINNNSQLLGRPNLPQEMDDLYNDTNE